MEKEKENQIKKPAPLSSEDMEKVTGGGAFDELPRVTDTSYGAPDSDVKDRV